MPTLKHWQDVDALDTQSKKSAINIDIEKREKGNINNNKSEIISGSSSHKKDITIDSPISQEDNNVVNNEDKEMELSITCNNEHGTDGSLETTNEIEIIDTNNVEKALANAIYHDPLSVDTTMARVDDLIGIYPPATKAKMLELTSIDEVEHAGAL